MAEITFGKSRVIKNHYRSRPELPDFKLNQRVHARIPAARPPGLNNSLIRDQFDVSTGDQAAEGAKGASGFAADLRGHAGEGGKLFGIEQSLVNTLRRHLKINFLVEISEESFSTGAGRLLHFLVFLRLCEDGH